MRTLSDRAQKFAALVAALIVFALAFTSLPGATPVAAQSTQPAFDKISRAVATELSGERALSTVAFVEQFFRLPGNRGFDASIDTVVALLRAAGYVEESARRPSDRLTYRVESYPLSAPAWTPDSASLTIVGRSAPLMRWATNHNMLAINSGSTPAGGVTAQVIDIGNGADSVFNRLDVRGRIVFTTGATRSVFPRAMQNGALGVLAVQRLPAYNKPQKNVTAIGFSSIPLDTVSNGWLIFLPPAYADSMRAALGKDAATRVHVVTATRFDKNPERTVVAEIRGSTLPQERFVYSAHVQEPGANDNASGVGLLAEIARTAAVLVKSGQANPTRTMTFLWGDEIRSTRRFITQDAERRTGIKWGMSLDMVGENTELTGGTFLIEKMPDPSAVWVRGEDQHSEWGGWPLDVSAIRSHWLNDFTRQRCLDRARTTNWVVKSNPYEGGSDHSPFLDAKIPAVLFWHFTDQYYHTDRDRIEMVSANTLANVGNCALASGLILATGGAEIATGVLEEIGLVAIRVLATQAALSRDTLARGGSIQAEQIILETWSDYYRNALSTVSEIAPVSRSRLRALNLAIREETARHIESLFRK